MSTFDPYDDEALRAEARDEARRDRADHLVRQVAELRPAVFAAPGQLRAEVTDWIGRYLRGDTGSLLLYGAVGTGKTWSIWKTREVLARHGWAGTFEIASYWEIKAANDRPVDRERLNRWANADLFAIDDLGAQRVNDWDADGLAILVDRRWQHQRPLILSTNEDDLRGLVGERAASRIAHNSTVVQFGGGDRRRTQV